MLSLWSPPTRATAPSSVPQAATRDSAAQVGINLDRARDPAYTSYIYLLFLSAPPPFLPAFKSCVLYSCLSVSTSSLGLELVVLVRHDRRRARRGKLSVGPVTRWISAILAAPKLAIKYSLDVCESEVLVIVQDSTSSASYFQIS